MSRGATRFHRWASSSAGAGRPLHAAARNDLGCPRRLTLTLILLGPLLATPAPAQAPATTDVAAGVVLPSATCQGLFIVPLTVGEGEGKTLDVILDTGSSGTFVDPDAMHRILSGQVRAGKVLFREGRIGRHEFGPLRARVLPMKPVSLALGRTIDGILGFPAFKDLLLTLDYPAEEIRVSLGSLPPPDGREVFRDAGDRRPKLKVDVGGRRVKVLLDSGATSRFLLKPTDRLTWSVEPRPVATSVTFHGVFVEEGGRLDGGLQFGPLRFEDPVVLIAERERLAGWHVLHHFVLTFDQKNKRIRMQSNRTTPVRLASWVRRGLAVHPRPQGQEIISVFPGTSAEAAGLREGDLITAINGTPVHELGCSDPQGDRAGQRLSLSYLRAGVQAEAEIETDTLIP